MKILAIAPLEYLEIENVVNGIDLGYFFITKGENLLKKLANNYTLYQPLHSLMEGIGTNGYGDIVNNNTILVLEDTETIFEDKKFESLYEINESLAKMFFGVLSNLWFIRDNNIVFRKIYLCDIENNEWVVYKISNASKNAEGLTKTVFYSKEEFHKSAQYLAKLNIYQSLEDDIPAQKKDIIPNVETTLNENHIQYNMTRINRALKFNQALRINPMIIIRISFYMAMFECLFTSDDKEITKTIKNRVSQFTNESNKVRKSYKYLLNTAYNIRSRYLHGENIEESPEDLIKISVRLDNLARVIFLKIFNMEDKNIFTTPENQGSKDTFEAYFNDRDASSKSTPCDLSISSSTSVST